MPLSRDKRGINTLGAADVFELFGETLDGYALVKPRHALNDGRHLREDSTGLEPIIGRAVDLTAALSLGTGQVASPSMAASVVLPLPRPTLSTAVRTRRSPALLVL